MLCYKSNGNAHLHFSPKITPFKDDNFILNTIDTTIVSEGYYLSSTPKAEDSLLNYQHFTNTFKGRYVFTFLNHNTQELTIYNDLLSKKFVFYYAQPNFFAASTSFLELLSFLKKEGKPLTLDEQGRMQMLSRGSFMGDTTYIKEIKFLKAFHYITVSDSVQVNALPYPEPKFNEPFDETVNTAYALFQQACQEQLAKNLSHDQIVSLSGGMDSRAVFMQLQQLGVHSLSSYTYAQSHSADEKIAKQIAKDYGVPNAFYPLDGGEFVAFRKEMLALNEGQMYYCGATGMYQSVQQLQSPNPGLLHLGIGGGEIMGDILSPNDEQPYAPFPKKSYAINLDDIRTCQNSALMASQKFETASPFLYEDFFLYLMRLPQLYKHHRKLYVEMFKRFMPNNYSTTAFKGKMGKRNLLLRVCLHYWEALFKKNAYSMNPFDYWWKTNPNFRKILQSMFNEDIAFLHQHHFPTNEFSKAFQGDVPAKCRVLTYTGMLRYYILGE